MGRSNGLSRTPGTEVDVGAADRGGQSGVFVLGVDDRISMPRYKLRNNSNFTR